MTALGTRRAGSRVAAGIALAAVLMTARGVARGAESPLPEARSAPLLEELRARLASAPDRERALEILRRFQEAVPERSQDAAVLEEIERRGRFRFTLDLQRPIVVEPGHRLWLGPGVAGRFAGLENPPSRFLVHRVPAEVYRRLLEECEPGTLPSPLLALPGSTPVELTKSDQNLYLPRTPGLYLVEERMEGFRKVVAVTVSSCALYQEAVPGRVLAHVHDGSGSPPEGVEFLVRWAGGSTQASPGSRGFAVLECGGKATLIARWGEEVLASVVDPHAEDEDVVYLTTDRPLYRPGETVRWKAVLRRRIGSSSGRQEVRVYPRRGLLDVEMNADRGSCRPSEKVKLSLRTSRENEPLPAEVELKVVAEPPLGAPADTTVDIRRFFNSSWHRYSYWCGTCAISPGDEQERIRRLQLRETEAETPEGEPFVGPLPQTILWLPQVRTGPDGRAEVELEAPAQSGVLRVTARAVSGPTRFGQAEASIRVE